MPFLKSATLFLFLLIQILTTTTVNSLQSDEVIESQSQDEENEQKNLVTDDKQKNSHPAASPPVGPPAIQFTGLTHENGTCCHVNSVIQLLYFIPEFRRALYKWEPKASRTKRSKLTGSIIEVIDCPQNVALVLQSIFARMQNSALSVGLPVRTIQLVKALKKTDAWAADSGHNAQAHDPFWILSKILQILNPLLKGTIDSLFSGIKRRDRNSSKMEVIPGHPESYKNIPVNLSLDDNNDDLLQWLRRETESWQPEIGAKGAATGFTTKTAFLSFPPILIFSPQNQIQAANSMVKSTQFNFPTKLPMTEFLERGGDGTINQINYELMAVVTSERRHDNQNQKTKKSHSFIDIDVHPNEDKDQGQWYRFDDVRVSQVVPAILDADGGQKFGGHILHSTGPSSSSEEESVAKTYLMVVYRKVDGNDFGDNGQGVVEVPPNLPRRAKDFGVTGCRKVDESQDKKSGKSEL